jgi:hypothetical protein
LEEATFALDRALERDFFAERAHALTALVGFLELRRGDLRRRELCLTIIYIPNKKMDAQEKKTRNFPKHLF